MLNARPVAPDHPALVVGRGRGQRFGLVVIGNSDGGDACSCDGGSGPKGGEGGSATDHGFGSG